MNVMNLFRLDGGKAVVVGASQGIGRAIAVAFAEAGADVVAGARSEEGVLATAEQVRAIGRRGLGLTLDARDPASVAAFGEAAADFLGGVTMWVNAVGGIIGRGTPNLIDMSPEDFDAMAAMNVRTVWLGAKAAAAAMEGEGAIVNISSLAGGAGAHVGFGAYGAAKAAVNSLTATLSHELAPRIRVNAIAPGSILTEAFLKLAKAKPEDLPPPADTPLGRYGLPMDIAAAALFLASPASGWITGQCLPVTGGRFFRREVRAA